MRGRKRIHPIYTKEECILNLQYMTIELGHVPTIKEYENNPFKIAPAYIITKLFGKFSIALNEAGLESYYEKYLPEKILENLRIVTKDIGHPPTISEYEAHPKHICTESAITKRFGNYRSALACAGLDSMYTTRHHKCNKKNKIYIKKPYTKKNNLVTNVKKEDILNNLQVITNDIGHPPSTREFRTHPLRICSECTIDKYFGSYNNAIKEAGFIPHLSKHLSQISVTKEVIINRTKEIIKKLGRLPKSSEILIPGEYYRFSYESLHRYYKDLPDLLKDIGYSDEEIWDKRYTTYSDEELLQDLYRVMISNPTIHFKEDFFNLTKASRLPYTKRFGSIDNVFKIMYLKYGLCIPKHPRIQHGWGISEIQRIAKELQKVPTCKEFYIYSQYKGVYPEINFHHGYKNLLIKSGVDFYPQKKYKSKELKNSVIQSIQNMTKAIKHIPTCKQYVRSSFKIIGRSTIQKMFGSWDAALIAAGLKGDNLMKQRIINSIQNIVNDIGAIPTVKAYKTHPLHIYSIDTIYKYFGSWNKALMAAGLKK